MNTTKFPFNHFCGEINRFMDAIKYDECNLSLPTLAENMRYVHARTRAYFDQDLPRATLKQVKPARVVAVTSTIPQFVVYCWSRIEREVQVDISIFLSIINLLDDESNSAVHSQMTFFWNDLLQGKQQEHPFWILMNEHLPRLLSHYGSFCSFNIMRCLFDFFEGCWIEQHNFQGYPGSECFPLFVRRLNSLGGAVGGTIFPASDFNEQKLFKELSCVMAHITGPVAFINDLFSFYKEFDQDEANLLSNWCTVDGIGIIQAFERLTDEAIRSCVQILDLFRNKDPEIFATVQSFIYGYVSWHFGEQRYRLHEIYEIATHENNGAKFRKYYEKAINTGWCDRDQWRPPTDWSFSPKKPESHQTMMNGVRPRRVKVSH